MGTQINCDGEHIYLHTERTPLSLTKARGLPGRRFVKSTGNWVAPASMAAWTYLTQAFPEAQWTRRAEKVYQEALAREDQRDGVLLQRYGEIDTSHVDDFVFKTEPFKHQLQALALGAYLPSFAYLMDQGTGKTWTLINDMALNWTRSTIDASIVLVPNSIKFQWASEIEKHSSVSVEIGVWVSQPNAKQKAAWRKFEEACEDKSKLVWVIVNVEAVAMPRVYKWLEAFLLTRKCALSVDESTRIKNRTSKRSKAVIKLRNHAKLARIMSGTPVVKSPMDAFAQFKFLDVDILGYSNFYSFRNRYGILGGYHDKQVVSYKNLDELAHRIQSCSFRVTKDECLDLPPKMPPVRRDVQMDPVQKREYNRMREEFLAQLEDPCEVCHGVGFGWEYDDVSYEGGHTVTCHRCGGTASTINATIALTQVLRLQQIASGFITDGPNLTHWFTDNPPKIRETLELLEECGDQQIILWSNHKPEINRLCQFLSLHNKSYVEYHGDIRPEKREENRLAFQAGNVDYLVGHPAAGGIGVDLWRASGAIYLSNSFRTEDRVQSEDRCHRIGSEIHESVNYWDTVVPGTVDVKILRVIRNNRSVSDEIMAGGLRGLLHESETP